ncbi:MAG TPA: hypothetical protein PKA00_13995 [Saprospiraceae bacterium]|nr:hypothetical protein [Saprospiraceae bacterium]HMQ84023.1 hypothetical protein [Saprospiraceae bacterium]
MQLDYLEQYILQRKEAFEEGTPPPQLWGEINQKLDEHKNRRQFWLRIGKIAATVCILLCCGALVGSYLTRHRMNRLTALEKIAPEYAALEKQYQQQIDQKYELLTSYRPGSSVEADLAQLDAVMEELRQELLIAPKGQEKRIVESLLNNYRAKVAILERVLDRIDAGEPKTVKEAKQGDGYSI